MIWWSAGQSYLERLGHAEYRQQMSQHGKRSKKSFRYHPSPYHRQLVDLLGKNDEEGFKQLKALEGYANALGF
jgi:hypothetical protein